LKRSLIIVGHTKIEDVKAVIANIETAECVSWEGFNEHTFSELMNYEALILFPYQNVKYQIAPDNQGIRNPEAIKALLHRFQFGSDSVYLFLLGSQEFAIRNPEDSLLTGQRFLESILQDRISLESPPFPKQLLYGKNLRKPLADLFKQYLAVHRIQYRISDSHESSIEPLVCLSDWDNSIFVGGFSRGKGQALILPFCSQNVSPSDLYLLLNIANEVFSHPFLGASLQTSFSGLQRAELESDLLKSSYLTHFEQFDFVTLTSWAREHTLTNDQSEWIFQALRKRGFAEIKEKGPTIGITIKGILHAEQAGIAPDEMRERNDQVRIRILETLERLKKESGESYQDVWYVTLAPEAGITEMELDTNSPVLRYLGLIKHPTHTGIAITENGLKWLIEKRDHEEWIRELEMQSQKELPPLDIRTLKFAILEVLSKTNHQHKINIIGRPYQKGDLESVLGRIFSSEQRALAGKAVAELTSSGHIVPTYSDLVDPENWLKITEKGKKALELQSLDDLDQALRQLDPAFVDLRYAILSALVSNESEPIRHAAHSARELLRQVLDKLAPEDEIRANPNFTPSKDSKTGITRKMRVRHAMEKLGNQSDSDAELVANLSEQIDILYNKLSAEAHRNVGEQHKDITDVVNITESALKRLLV